MLDDSTNANEVEILLVEDNPNDAELTLRALKKHHLANKVLHVKDGAEALEFLFANGAYDQRKVENVPRVILLDLKLPKLDGLAVLREIKAHESTKTIPVIAITASAMTHNRQTMLAEGFDGYQTKPISLKEFLREIERTVNLFR